MELIKNNLGVGRTTEDMNETTVALITGGAFMEVLYSYYSQLSSMFDLFHNKDHFTLLFSILIF